ncbi:MAG TPA: hypothetical protein VJ785_13825 [Anaerolineales bacterium]|nr:hypothetical protein [Anaerolineales bacterium]
MLVAVYHRLRPGRGADHIDADGRSRMRLGELPVPAHSDLAYILKIQSAPSQADAIAGFEFEFTSYHSIRQLILVNRIVKMVEQFNLFQLDPVYAFSGVTALTGISLLLMLSLTLIVFPLQLASGPVLVMLLGQVALTVAAFVLPLLIVHQRPVAEKRDLLADINKRVTAILSLLHQNLDEYEFGEVSGLNDAISGLIVERDLIHKIPTWPWRAGTLTSFLTAILLPILLFLAQVVLGNWLGG